MRQGFDTRLQLDERPEVSESGDAASAHLSDGVGVLDARPRVGGKLLQPERDLLLVIVDAQDLDGDLVAGLEQLSTDPTTRDHPISETCSRPCTPPPRSTNAPKSRTDATRPLITAPATIERRTSAALARCCFLEKRAARDDDVLAAFLVFDDAELIDAAFVGRRVGAGGVDLRDRAERTQPCYPHLVSTFHRPLDLAFDRETRVERVLELACGCRARAQPA